MRVFLISLFLLIATVGLANAAIVDLSGGSVYTTTISFSNLNLMKNVKYLIYQGDAYLGEVNATDTVILDATKDYLIVIKPDQGVWFSDPLQTLQLAVASIPQAFSIVLGLGVAFLILGLIARALGFRIGW